MMRFHRLQAAMLFEHERPSATASPAGRCFRTAADGRIALTRDWPALLRESYRAGRFAVQTRHASARLIKITDLGELALRAGGAIAVASDETGVLGFRFGSWGRAWGFLRSCECCGSPGRLEVRNRKGGEFLQFSALPVADPHSWSEYLAAVASSTVREGHALALEPATSAAAFELPRLRRASVRLPFHLEGLGTLLNAFGDEGLAICCTVSTADLLHRRDIVPRGVTEHAGILSAGEPGARVQLAWPAVQALALTSDVTGWSLHIVGADDAVLLTLSAAADPRASAAWRGALRTAFPGLR